MTDTELTLMKSVSDVKRQVNSAGKYNIFSVLEVSDKEVTMCRFLYDLLDSNGFHGRDTFYLRSFFKNILGFMDMSDKEIDEFQIYKEYVIDKEADNSEDRRIDLVLYNNKLFIPVEVKINAREQKAQCFDYYQYACKRSVNPNQVKIVYLTKYGTMPSPYSTKEKHSDRMVEEKDIYKISFVKDIYNWLDDCSKDDTSEVGDIIRQYMGVLRNMKENEFEEMKRMVAKDILTDASTLRAAIMISDSVNNAKVELMKVLFKDFEKAMEPLLEKYPIEPEIDANWYTYKEQCTEDFYRYNYSTYPGLNYLVKTDKLSSGKALWLRVEIDHNLFAGFCAFDYSKKTEEGAGDQIDSIDKKTFEEYQKCVDINEGTGSWWLKWIYLPTGTDKNNKLELVPNFKMMNETAITLVDEKIRKELIQNSIEQIEKRLLSLLK